MDEQPAEETAPTRVGITDRGWLIGSALSLAWVIPMLLELWRRTDLAPRLIGTALTLVFAALFLCTVPLIRRLRSRAARLLPAAALFAVSLTLVPWIGADVRWMWTFVGVAIAVSRVPLLLRWVLLVALSASAFLIGEQIGTDPGNSALNAAVILSVSVMMSSFTDNVVTLARLRAAQDQVADMAAERERGRVARDIHDILGHSLTVITVKAELAGRLIDVDSDRAREEIAEVEQLARGALADVRTTVHGFRGVSVSGELAAARAALDAAGIEADLPGATDQIPPVRRELAGWVVREAVTNVVRHSGAARCRIRLDARSIEVVDDGSGPGAAKGSGSGLTGLRERVEAAGGRMSVGRADARGGFRVRVTW